MPVAVELKGRPRKQVVLQTRPSGKTDAPWKSDADRRPGESSRGEGREGQGPGRVPGRRRPGREPGVRDPGPLPAGDQDARGQGHAARPTPGSNPRPPRGATSRPSKARPRRSGSPSTPLPSEAALELVDPSAKAPKKGEPAPGPTILPLEAGGQLSWSPASTCRRTSITRSWRGPTTAGSCPRTSTGSTSARTGRLGSSSTSPTRRSRSTRSPRSGTAPGSTTTSG